MISDNKNNTVCYKWQNLCVYYLHNCLNSILNLLCVSLCLSFLYNKYIFFLHFDKIYKNKKCNNKMRLLFFYFVLANSNKFIRNINIPSCKNCIHHEPYLFTTEYASTLSRCKKFGEKNVISGIVTHDYIDLCRKDEDKCGKEGKYFEKDEYEYLKWLKHKIILNIGILIIIINFSYYTFNGNVYN